MPEEHELASQVVVVAQLHERLVRVALPQPPEPRHRQSVQRPPKHLNEEGTGIRDISPPEIKDVNSFMSCH